MLGLTTSVAVADALANGHQEHVVARPGWKLFVAQRTEVRH